MGISLSFFKLVEVHINFKICIPKMLISHLAFKLQHKSCPGANKYGIPSSVHGLYWTKHITFGSFLQTRLKKKQVIRNKLQQATFLVSKRIFIVINVMYLPPSQKILS